MTSEILKQRVSQILRKPGIQKINFQFGPLKVTGQNLILVAQAIDIGAIECQVGQMKDSGPVKVKKGYVIEATYKADLDAMLFPNESYGTTTTDICTIVHESVHASFDLLSPGQTFAIEDESAAVLTEAIYVLVCLDGKKGSYMMDEAWNLAGQMSVATESFTTSDTYILDKVDKSETAELREAIAKRRGFVKVPDKTGYTDNSTLKYIYNGVARCNKSGVCK